jgi:transposase InsO family protein
MSQASSISAQRRFGLQRICRVTRVGRSTVYWQRGLALTPEPDRLRLRRRGPLGACSDDELVGHIRTVLEESPFHGEGYRKVWARLRHRDVRTSKERVRRLMRDNGLQAPHRAGNRRGPRAHDGTIITEAPDTRWGTDLTSTVTLGEGTATVFVAVDHCTCECIGLHAAKSANRFEALEPIRQGVREHFACFAEGIATGLELRHDHGSQYMSDDFQNELAFLGITSSPSFVREPEGNGCAERFIRTLKENLLWVKTFRTTDELREALIDFKAVYNQQWLIQRHGHRTPAQVRQEMLALTAADAAA